MDHLRVDAQSSGKLMQSVLVLLHCQQPAFNGATAHLLEHAPEGPGLLLVVPKGQVAAIGQHIQVLVLQRHQKT